MTIKHLPDSISFRSFTTSGAGQPAPDSTLPGETFDFRELELEIESSRSTGEDPAPCETGLSLWDVLKNHLTAPDIII